MVVIGEMKNKFNIGDMVSWVTPSGLANCRIMSISTATGDFYYELRNCGGWNEEGEVLEALLFPLTKEGALEYKEYMIERANGGYEFMMKSLNEGADNEK